MLFIIISRKIVFHNSSGNTTSVMESP